MTIKTFKMWQKSLSAIIGAVIAVSVLRGNAWIPLPTVMAGLLIVFLLKRRVTEVIEDERVHTIAAKASRLTVQIGCIAMAVTGATFIALSRGGVSWAADVGFSLAYAACGLLVIYYLAYNYFQGKLGGE